MNIVIIGNGISGITCARWLRKKSDHNIQIISDESKYFYSRTALMYIYMGHMTFEHTMPYEKSFWSKNNLNLVHDHVVAVDYHNKSLKLASNKVLNYDKLIFAVGSKPNKFGWPGENLNGVGTLYHLKDLDYLEKHSRSTKKAVIVGGGLIGIELAEMFKSRNVDVTMLVREVSYWNNVLPPEESEIITETIKSHGIDLKLNTNLKSIVGNDQSKVEAVITNEQNEKLFCDFVGLTAGVRPNVDWLKNGPLNINKGILVNRYLQTNIENVYAIGDCAELEEPMPNRRSIEAVWYTGRIMGETVANNILNKNLIAYNPGIWFNSAKFFDIEYQVYGNVPANIEDPLDSILWQEKDKSVRIVFNKNENSVVGFNLLGIRFRHEVCEKWIQFKTPMKTVLENLNLADFNPEFYKTYALNLIDQYNRKHNTNINLQSRRSLDKVIKFLKGNNGS